jgi:predicted dehydrogenase
MMQSSTPRFAQEPLKLGFVGGSIRSAVGYAHFVSCAMDKRWQLVAGCFSRDPVVNHETAQAYGVGPGRVYGTLEDMLEAERRRLDAVVILTPTPAHFEDVMACMRAGIPVICEKSLAVNRRQARAILKLRDELNAFLAVTYNYSGYPMLRELADRIGRGKLGKILHFTAEMPQEGFVRVDARGNKPVPQSWRLTDRNIPTLHLDLAVHLHQIMHYLTGQKPVEVVSDQNHYGWFAGVVDNATCLCRYTGDIQGTLWFSKSALGQRNGLRIRIYGDQGAAEWYQLNPEELVLSFIDGRREILDRGSAVEISNQPRYNRFKTGHPAGFIEAFANLYRDIADAVQQYKLSGTWQSNEVFSAELAMEGMEFLEAMVSSAKSRTWQAVGDVSERHPWQLKISEHL